MNNEIKEITKVDKQLLDKIEHILANELNCEEYDKFYNYFNEIKKPSILIDIKDDENIKDYITNLQQENERLKGRIEFLEDINSDQYAKIEELEQENERLKELEYEFIDDSGDNASFTLENYLDIGNKLYDCEREKEDYKSRCENAIEYITSYEAISTIQGLDKIEQNKTLDERTMNVMIERYLQVHHNLLNILQNGDNKDD